MSHIGTGYVVGFSEQAAWGTAAATVDNYHHAFPGMESLKLMSETIEGDDSQNRGIDSDNVDPGSRHVEGPLQTDIQFGGGWLLYFAQIVGNDPTTAGVGPYTHTVPVGADLGGAKDNRNKAITVFTDREGQTAGAGAKTASYKDIRPSSLELAFAYNARARMSMDLFGSDLAGWGARLTPSLPSRGWILNPSRAATPSPSLSYGGADFDCKESTFKVEQEHDLEGGDMQSPTMGRPEPNGRTKVTGTFTVEAPESAAGTGGVFMDDYAAKTMKAIVLTFDGATPTDEKLVITIPKARITNAADPEVAGPGRIMFQAEWEGYFDSASGHIAELVLTSLDSAAWA